MASPVCPCHLESAMESVNSPISLAVFPSTQIRYVVPAVAAKELRHWLTAVVVPVEPVDAAEDTRLSVEIDDPV
jgi:hypothetical protein